MKSKEFKRIFHLIIFEKIIFNNQNLLNQHATNIIFKFMHLRNRSFHRATKSNRQA